IIGPRQADLCRGPRDRKRLRHLNCCQVGGGGRRGQGLGAGAGQVAVRRIPGGVGVPDPVIVFGSGRQAGVLIGGDAGPGGGDRGPADAIGGAFDLVDGFAGDVRPGQVDLAGGDGGGAEVGGRGGHGYTRDGGGAGLVAVRGVAARVVGPHLVIIGG